jgi:hypothetical protein
MHDQNYRAKKRIEWILRDMLGKDNARPSIEGARTYSILVLIYRDRGEKTVLPEIPEYCSPFPTSNN